MSDQPPPQFAGGVTYVEAEPPTVTDLIDQAVVWLEQVKHALRNEAAAASPLASRVLEERQLEIQRWLNIVAERRGSTGLPG